MDYYATALIEIFVNVLAKEQVHEKATREREAKRAVRAASSMNSRHQR